MKNKTTDNTAKIISYLKKLESSLRKEIKNGDKLIRQEILKIEERVEGLEGKQEQMDKKLDNIQNTLDGFVGKVEALEQENVIGTEHYRDHEKRISKLEATIQST